MIEIDDQARKYLLGSIRRGEAFLALGAGASKTSKNRFGKDVALGRDLAALLAERSGITYAGESLKAVLSACIPGIISKPQFHDILSVQFQDVKPSNELQEILNFSWKRIYTWNIDDALEGVKSSAQRRRYYNGMSDKAHIDNGIDILPIVHLHGEAAKPEHGFIFTDAEYNQSLIEGRHSWYRQIAQDYVSSVPIFIGSQLDEPILSLEVDRSRPSQAEPLGQAFLVSPDDISEIQRMDYRARQIVYLQGTLSEFVDFLKAELGKSYRPADIASEVSAFAAQAVSTKSISGSDAIAATYIYQIKHSEVLAEIGGYTAEIKSAAARNYLEGAPPSWRIAASDAPVWLSQTNDLFRFVTRTIFDADRVAIVVGQAGSGKSTALMQSLLRYSRDNDDIAFYEIRGEVPSLRAALEVLNKTIVQDHIVIYISDVFVFGDSFMTDVMAMPKGRMTILTSARTGEWNSRLRRQMKDESKTFTFERFAQNDYQPLIDRLLKFVPSPALLRMSPAERRQRLGQSGSQLLIALKETTYAEAFTNVITAEFEGLATLDEQRLLLICGLGSLSRAGVDFGAAREAYNATGPKLPFGEALNALGGIVVRQSSGRLAARHELYVRHIFESVADFQEIVEAINGVLETFTKYDHPIIKNVARLDAILFRYLLSHNFIKDIATSHGSRLDGLNIYKNFELAFQLDGHFWLQYGQYLSEVGELDEAMIMFDRSIRAYEENEFAWHALADLQLRVAARRTTFDANTRELISKAVATLTGQDETMGGPSDHYAIVTLAHGHIGALVRHKQLPQAQEAARRYMARLSEIRRYNDDEMLRQAYERLLKFTTVGEWADSPFASQSRKKGGRSRPKRPHK